MKVDIAYDSIEQPWAHEWKQAMCAGVRACGDTATLLAARDCLRSVADVTVTWGLRGSRRTMMNRAADRGKRHLIMERGYIGDRKQWTALTFDGIGGKGEAPVIEDPQRFALHHGNLMRPWRTYTSTKQALVMGQVTGDATIAHVNFASWAKGAVADLRSNGWEVFYRHHPEERAQRRVAPPGATILADMALESAFRFADLVITFNSTAAVNAVLFGLPTYAADRGSPAWDVTARAMVQTTPARGAWAAQLAWRQWTLEEIRSGFAWSHVRTIAARD